MRQEYQADLAEVNRLLVTMAEGVRAALHRATGALLNADRTEAEEVVHADAEIDAVYQQVEDKVYDLLARQAPVASDLRLVVTALHIAADLERMGDLAEHVAKIAIRRAPAVAVPEELRPVIRDMAEAADRIGGQILPVLAPPDAAQAPGVAPHRAEIDQPPRPPFRPMLRTARPARG